SSLSVPTGATARSTTRWRSPTRPGLANWCSSTTIQPTTTTKLTGCWPWLGSGPRCLTSTGCRRPPRARRSRCNPRTTRRRWCPPA
ncbi:uncharacterized protein METZ01_LOCUS422091, partial [marine metagenome]